MMWGPGGLGEAGAGAAPPSPGCWGYRTLLPRLLPPAMELGGQVQVYKYFLPAQGCHQGDRRGVGTVCLNPHTACPNSLSDCPHPCGDCRHSSHSPALRLSLAAPSCLPPGVSWCDPLAREHCSHAGCQQPLEHSWSIPGASQLLPPARCSRGWRSLLSGGWQPLNPSGVKL